MLGLLLAASLLTPDNEPDPAPIPDQIRAMLEAAMAAGNENDVATIARYARAAAPASAARVERMVADWRRERQQANEHHLREADFLDLMRGRIELGGTVNTGNTDNIGLAASMDLKREGLVVRHKFRVQAEYQESLGVATRERYLASWEPNYKIDEHSYFYSALQFESDRFSGYDERYSASVGAGRTAIRNREMTLALELGPAYRRTIFTDGTTQSNFAARGSLDFDWRLSPGITFSQDASAYLQDANSTVSSKSALRARLFGPLSAQLSYQLQFESDPPSAREHTDTTTRAALVFDF